MSANSPGGSLQHHQATTVLSPFMAGGSPCLAFTGNRPPSVMLCTLLWQMLPIATDDRYHSRQVFHFAFFHRYDGVKTDSVILPFTSSKRGRSRPELEKRGEDQCSKTPQTRETGHAADRDSPRTVGRKVQPIVREKLHDRFFKQCCESFLFRLKHVRTSSRNHYRGRHTWNLRLRFNEIVFFRSRFAVF